MASNRNQLPPHHKYPSAWPAAVAISAGIQNNLILLSDLDSNPYNNNNNHTNLDYQVNPTLPETLYDDFSRLTLSGFPDQAGHAGVGSFLGNSNSPLLDPPHGRGGIGGGFFLGNNNNPPLLDSPATDIRATNIYLQRVRIESAIKGQMHRQMLGFQGMDTYGYDIHTNNNSSFSLNRVMPTIRPRANRNGFQSNKTYDTFDIDRFEVENPNNLMTLVRTNNNNSSNAISTTSSTQLYRWPAPQRQVAMSYSSLEEVRGRIYRLAKDQMGCRFLRDKFEGRKQEEIEMIFLEVKDHVRDLMVDQFGNYLIQKFFDVCNEEQMNQILRSVISDSRNLLVICIDMHGTRAMQKLLENLTTQNQKSSVVSVLKHITLTLTKNMNGHHVIEQCLKLFTNEQTKPILDVVAQNCLDIATDKNGCCVLQQCVAHAQGTPKRQLVDQITSNSLVLSEHAYGNYVVQFILGLSVPQYTTDILRQLAGSFITLSMNKYGSNVVEKCLRESSEDQASQIINELLNSKDFLMALQDPYGNYVAQSALKQAKDKQKLINAIQEHYAFIHSHPHGKRVLSRIKELSKHQA